jgi:hypothetical protein
MDIIAIWDLDGTTLFSVNTEEGPMWREAYEIDMHPAVLARIASWHRVNHGAIIRGE